MRTVKIIIGTAFISGIIGMCLAMVALQSGVLGGFAYWVIVPACAVLSGGSILAAKAAYDYEEWRERR